MGTVRDEKVRVHRWRCFGKRSDPSHWNVCITETDPTEEHAMNATETIPTTWDDARDGQFFRITAHVLDARFLEAATSLLMANDNELVTV